MNISFIGLGKLGLPLASLLAANNNVLAIDSNKSLISELKECDLNFTEPNLNEIFSKNFHNFTFSDKINEDIFTKTDSTIILVNTQVGDHGYSDQNVDALIKQLGEAFKHSKKNFHNFILSSTVLPGSINRLINTLEEISGKIVNKDFGFSYIPDFVKLGSVIKDFRNPDFFLVGANSINDYKNACLLWEGLHENNPEKINLSLEETEIAKVSLNAYIVNKISFSNFLSVLCKDIENVDVKNITDTIGKDIRIGNKFFSPGPPFGGTCFPRDTYAFLEFSNSFGLEANHVKFSNEINEMVYLDIINKLNKFKKVGILGVSFKENSDVLVGSPSIEIIKRLNKNSTVYVFDYLIKDLKTDKNVELCEKIEEVVLNSEVILIMHNDLKFREIDFKNKDIIDPWKLLNN